MSNKFAMTEIDFQLIQDQCELQDATSFLQLRGFTTAYTEAKHLASLITRLPDFTEEQVLSFINRFADYIEPRNQKGFRCVPVRFADHSTALAPQLIPRAMSGFAGMYAEALVGDNEISPDEAYLEFEEIHPFEDGNGRVGDLLWKMLMTARTGEWPLELPPDLFAEK